MFFRAAHCDPGILGRSSQFGHRNSASAREVIAGDGIFRSEQPLEGSTVDHDAAMLTSTRANIDHVVSDPNRFFVVFDHDHGVTEIA